MLRGIVLFIATNCFVFPLNARIHVNTKAVASAVVFIYASNNAGEADRPMGTGFVVQVPVVGNPNSVYMVLITARHVIEPEWARCGTANPTQIFLRVNKADYDPSRDASGVGFVRVALIADGNRKAQVPTDNEIDVAAIALQPNSIQGYDLQGIPLNEFATSEEMNLISVGDEITAAGLIPGIPGANRNYPFFKFGNISNPTEELVSVPCREGTQPVNLKFWFIACNLVPGNSGAPVIAHPSSPAGLLIGASGIKEIKRPVLIGIQSMSLVNADLAGMTPIRYVMEPIRKLRLVNADLDASAPTAKPGTE